MGLDGNSQQALINSLRKKIQEFNKLMNIPLTLKDFGIQEEEFKEKLPKIAELAVGDACTGSNPREITPGSDGKTVNLYLLWNRSRFLITLDKKAEALYCKNVQHVPYDLR